MKTSGIDAVSTGEYFPSTYCQVSEFQKTPIFAEFDHRYKFRKNIQRHS
jgi:hypothetical protein